MAVAVDDEPHQGSSAPGTSTENIVAVPAGFSDVACSCHGPKTGETDAAASGSVG
jgi:hypothetical protein